MCNLDVVTYNSRLYIMQSKLEPLKKKLETLRQKISQTDNETLLILKINISENIQNGIRTLEEKFDTRAFEVLKNDVRDFEDLINVEERINKVRKHISML